jgi:uncharacterized protein (DUF302 family)
MSQINSGIIDVRSPRSVPQTIDRLEALAKARGLTVFGRIDFSGDAERAGLVMRPMQMLIFGNPKAGTALLVAAPRVGLDLPLKVLAWADDTDGVWLSCNDPHYLEARHGLPPALIANVSGVIDLMNKAAAPDA